MKTLLLKKTIAWGMLIGTCVVLVIPTQSFALNLHKDTLLNSENANKPLLINIPINVNEAANNNINSENNNIDIPKNTLKKNLPTVGEQEIQNQKKKKKILPVQNIQTNTVVTDTGETVAVHPLPKFERKVDEQLPATIERYQTFLSERRDKTEQTSILPETAKKSLKKTLDTETTWLQNKVQELKATDSVEDRQAIKQEIRSYVEERRNERRELIEKNITTPKTGSIEKAQVISTKFDAIIDQFARVGIDTTRLQTTLTDYNTTVQETRDILARLDNERSIEDIQALREHVVTLRELSSELRNQVQTILVQEQVN